MTVFFSNITYDNHQMIYKFVPHILNYYFINMVLLYTFDNPTHLRHF